MSNTASLSSIQSIPFDREKYLEILRTSGLHAAITALHLDVEQWDHEAFAEGKGFQEQVWTDLKLIRNFSRDLGNTARGETPRS